MHHQQTMGWMGTCAAALAVSVVGCSNDNPVGMGPPSLPDCPAGQALSTNSQGMIICRPLPIPPIPDCPAGQALFANPQGMLICRSLLDDPGVQNRLAMVERQLARAQMSVPMTPNCPMGQAPTANADRVLECQPVMGCMPGQMAGYDVSLVLRCREARIEPCPSGTHVATQADGRTVYCAPDGCRPSCAGRLCGNDGCGGTCGTCDDGSGCTTDSCSAEGRCVFRPACAPSQVVWGNLTSFTASTTSFPLTFPLATPTPTTVSVSRSNGYAVAPYDAPATAASGSFTSEALPGVRFSWDGPFRYINVNTPGPSTPNAGTVTVDFGRPATAHGAGWYYIFGITALGYRTEGPLTITASRPIERIGRLSVWGGASPPVAPCNGNRHCDAGETPANCPRDCGDPTTSYTLATRAITGPAGGPNTAMEFFLVDRSAPTLALTLSDAGTAAADTFGIFFGAVQLGETCTGELRCVARGGACGDGIKSDAEGCDDGNALAGDGCSPACVVEPSSRCATPVLTSYCGALGE